MSFHLELGDGDTLNTYGDDPYPNENTEPCE